MADQPVGAATQDAYGHTSTANQDAALQSLSVAQRALGAGELEKALKFARKSVSLYDTLVGRQLLAKLEKPAEAAPQPASTAEPPAAPAPAPAPAAAPASSSPPPAAEAPSQAAEAGGSSEAEAVVARVLAASTFYDVFGLPNKAPEAAVRKTYRRLAASLHPDRNTAPHPNPNPNPDPDPNPNPNPNPNQENLVLDAEGYLKLVDLGLAREP